MADPIEVRNFTGVACCCRKSAKLVSSGCLQQIQFRDVHCERISVMGSSKPSIEDESTKVVIHDSVEIFEGYRSVKITFLRIGFQNVIKF